MVTYFIFYGMGLRLVRVLGCVLAKHSSWALDKFEFGLRDVPEVHGFVHMHPKSFIYFRSRAIDTPHLIVKGKATAWQTPSSSKGGPGSSRPPQVNSLTRVQRPAWLVHDVSFEKGIVNIARRLAVHVKLYTLWSHGS